MERRRILYAGHVPGVGFRYTTVRVATGFDITGFVRNLPDGRVEVIAEGEDEELTAFQQALGEAMSGYIRKIEAHTESPTGEFKRFEIRF